MYDESLVKTIINKIDGSMKIKKLVKVPNSLKVHREFVDLEESQVYITNFANLSTLLSSLLVYYIVEKDKYLKKKCLRIVRVQHILLIVAHTKSFDNFLSILGERIKLSGFKAHAGGLDTSGSMIKVYG